MSSISCTKMLFIHCVFTHILWPFLCFASIQLVTTVSDEKKTMISGDYVGEEALVNDADHLAESTIKCALDSQILCISQKQFSV